MNLVRNVVGVVIQGVHHEWVTQFKVSYKVGNGNWRFIVWVLMVVKVKFKGSTDGSTKNYRYFDAYILKQLM